jgi:23S rRNA pseudouridine1911/1915/1917 synthase
MPLAPRDPVEHRFVSPEDAPRLDVLVASNLELSRNAAATLIANGDVLVDGKREKASYRANPGQSIVVRVTPPRSDAVIAEDIPLTIIYEDDDILVVDKPAGMVVHPAPGNWTGTLVNALKGRLGPEGRETGRPEDRGADDREGIVHRLDKETSGLLLVAKTAPAHRALSGAMKARTIVRRYAVLARGHLTDDRLTVERPIARDPRDRKRMAVVSTGRPARTDFARLARFDVGDLLRAHLHTGRTHQIRVHLASIGHPAIGDETYGGGESRRLVGLRELRHFLHAAWLVFKHPVTGAEMDLRSPLPRELSRALLTAAGEHAPAGGPGDADLLDHFGFYRLHL